MKSKNLILGLLITISLFLITCNNPFIEKLWEEAEEAPVIITFSLPDGAVDEPYSLQLEASGSGKISWELADGNLPDGLTFSDGGLIEGIPVTEGIFSFTIAAENDAGSSKREFFIKITAEVIAPAITTISLPDGVTGTEYNQQLAALGTQAYWLHPLVDGGSLPPGLTLELDGTIKGTPSSAGTYSFAVAAWNTAGTDRRDFSIVITGTIVPPTISTSSLADGAVGIPYSQQLEAAGTAAAWSITEGSLPDGLTFLANGTVSGIPSAAGTFAFTAAVANTAGADTKEFSITITTDIIAPVITTASLPDGNVDTPYSVTLEASGTAALWTLTSGSLPDGLTLLASGAILGIPKTSGTFGFIAAAANTQGSDARPFSITVTNTLVPPSISTAFLPDGAVGFSYNQQLSASGTVTAWLIPADGGSLPPGLNLSINGAISGTPSQAGDFDFAVLAWNAAGSDRKDFSITITTDIEAPTITTDSLPDGTIGSLYSFTLQASGTAAIWTVQDGSLPDGLTLLANGTITGTPSASGTFVFAVRAWNSEGNDAKELSINIPDLPPTILTTSLHIGVVGTAYEQTLVATGAPPIDWSHTGALPSGLSLSTDGVISGTPTTEGTFSFTVKAENNAGDDEKGMSITVASAPVAPAITTASLPDGVEGKTYNQKIGAVGTAPMIWAVVSGGLPEGLSLTPGTGEISGTPTVLGTSNFTIRVVNYEGGVSQNFSITVVYAPVPPTITTTILPSATYTVEYSFTLAATGTAPIEWSLDAGSLPTGLTLSKNGVISGTPMATGTSNFTVKAQNTADSDTRALSLTVTAVPPTIITTALAGGVAGTYYDKPIIVTGTGPIAWSIISGALPDGLDIAPATGRITGTPTVEGEFDFTVKAENTGGVDEKGLSITITPAPTAPAILKESLPDGMTGALYEQKLDASGTAPIKWTMEWNSTPLPNGLILYQDGTIFGRANTAGVFTFTVRAENSVDYVTKTLSIEITQGPIPPVITTPTILPHASQGIRYSIKLTATGTAPIEWELINGTTLPANLTLSRDGIISGTPQAAVFNHTFTVQAKNAAVDGITAKAFSLDVGYQITFNSKGGTPVETVWVSPLYLSPVQEPQRPTNTNAIAVPDEYPGGRFGGWFYDDRSYEDEAAVEWPLVPDRSRTLYALWGFRYGDTGPGGGIVFYRSEWGFTVDTGSGAGTSAAPFAQPYDKYTAYHLEAARVPPNNGSGSWISNMSRPLNTSIYREERGYGRHNSYEMMRGSGVYSSPSSYGPYCAAWRAASYNGGGKYDWFLPNIGEMELLIQNRIFMPVGAFSPVVGQFYWAASGYDYDSWSNPWPPFADREAHVIRFIGDGVIQKEKRKVGESFPVIPIRAF